MEKEVFEDVKNNQDQAYINSKCPNCGSKLAFVPGSNKVKCESCGSDFEIKSLGQGKLDDQEKDYFATLDKLNKTHKSVKQRTIKCDNCGANFILNDKTISTKCPYCSSNRVVVEEKQEELIKIDGVVPFALDKSQVKEKIQLWMKKRKMAPFGWKKKVNSIEFNGFYIPYYTYDSSTYSTYSAYRGDYYYVTVRTKNGTHQERRVKWTFVRGNLDEKFDDVLVSGVPTRVDKHIYRISSFDFKYMEKYQESFMLGYYSERPTLSLRDGFENAKKQMYDRIRQLCVSRIGGDTYKDLKVDSRFEDVTFKQIMAPIYSGSYQYQNKTKYFVCNGQTGQVSGDCPKSVIKISILVILILAIIALLFYFILKDDNPSYYYDCLKLFFK